MSRLHASLFCVFKTLLLVISNIQMEEMCHCAIQFLIGNHMNAELKCQQYLALKQVVTLAPFELYVLSVQHLACRFIEVTTISFSLIVNCVILHLFFSFPDCHTSHVLQLPGEALDMVMNCCNVTFALFNFSAAQKDMMSEWRLCQKECKDKDKAGMYASCLVHGFHAPAAFLLCSSNHAEGMEHTSQF